MSLKDNAKCTKEIAWLDLQFQQGTRQGKLRVHVVRPGGEIGGDDDNKMGGMHAFQ